MITSFTLKRGDTWSQTFLFRQPSGEPVDLTGATARLHLRDTRDALLVDATAYLTLDGPAGALALTVPAQVTQTFPIGKHVFDVELTYPDGTTKSTQTAQLNVIKDVTLP